MICRREAKDAGRHHNHRSRAQARPCPRVKASQPPYRIVISCGSGCDVAPEQNNARMRYRDELPDELPPLRIRNKVNEQKSYPFHYSPRDPRDIPNSAIDPPNNDGITINPLLLSNSRYSREASSTIVNVTRDLRHLPTAEEGGLSD